MTPTANLVPGAWVAEITGMLDLSAWPARVIVRRERPHPGAQLRVTEGSAR